jgi:hypothetical protein
MSTTNSDVVDECAGFSGVFPIGDGMFIVCICVTVAICFRWFVSSLLVAVRLDGNALLTLEAKGSDGARPPCVRGYRTNAFLKQKSSDFFATSVAPTTCASSVSKKIASTISTRGRKPFQTITDRFADFQGHCLNLHADFPLP